VGEWEAMGVHQSHETSHPSDDMTSNSFVIKLIKGEKLLLLITIFCYVVGPIKGLKNTS
jgi:hypothetical protein